MTNQQAVLETTGPPQPWETPGLLPDSHSSDGYAPEPALTPHRLRIIARLGEDGRIEHGVELANGRRVLPEVRFLAADAAVDRWTAGSAVEVAGTEIGTIRSRLLADGRVELGFRAADGEAITPEIRYLPADLPVDVWLRSGEIEVPPVAPADSE